MGSRVFSNGSPTAVFLPFRSSEKLVFGAEGKVGRRGRCDITTTSITSIPTGRPTRPTDPTGWPAQPSRPNDPIWPDREPTKSWSAERPDPTGRPTRPTDPNGRATRPSLPNDPIWPDRNPANRQTRPRPDGKQRPLSPPLQLQGLWPTLLERQRGGSGGGPKNRARSWGRLCSNCARKVLEFCSNFCVGDPWEKQKVRGKK